MRENKYFKEYRERKKGTCEGERWIGGEGVEKGERRGRVRGRRVWEVIGKRESERVVVVWRWWRRVHVVCVLCCLRWAWKRDYGVWTSVGVFGNCDLIESIRERDREREREGEGLKKKGVRLWHRYRGAPRERLNSTQLSCFLGFTKNEVLSLRMAVVDRYATQQWHFYAIIL